MAFELPPIIQTIINRVVGIDKLERQIRSTNDVIKKHELLADVYKRQKTAIVGLIASYSFMSDRLIRSSRLTSELGKGFKSLQGAIVDLAMIPILPFFLALLTPMEAILGLFARNPEIAAFAGALILVGAALHRLMLTARIGGFIWNESFTKTIRDSILAFTGINKKMSDTQRKIKMLKAAQAAGASQATLAIGSGLAVTGGINKLIKMQDKQYRKGFRISDLGGFAKKIFTGILESTKLILIRLFQIVAIAALNMAAKVGIGPTKTVQGRDAAGRFTKGKTVPVLPPFLVSGTGAVKALASLARVASIILIIVAALEGLRRGLNDLKFILEPLGPIIEPIVDTLSRFISLEGLGKIVSVAFEALVTAFHIATITVGTFIGFWVKVFTLDFKGAGEIATRGFNKIIETLFNLGQKIDDLTGGALSRFKNWFHGEAIPAISGFFNTIGEWFRNLPGNVAVWMSSIVSTIGGWLGSIPNAIWGMLPDWLKNAIGTTASVASATGSWWQNNMPSWLGGSKQAGTRYIPNDDWYYLHRGEQVVRQDRSTNISGQQNVIINYSSGVGEEPFGFASKLGLDLRFSFLGALGSLR